MSYNTSPHGLPELDLDALSSASCLTPDGTTLVQKPLRLFDPTAPSNKPLHLLPSFYQGPRTAASMPQRPWHIVSAPINKPQEHPGLIQLYTWQREVRVNSPGRAACLPGRGQSQRPRTCPGLPVEAAREKPVLSDFPDSCGGSREMFPSQAPARQPLWAHHLPTAFCLGVLLCLDKLPSPTVQQCFYTPQGSCSVMKTKHSTLRKKAGGREGAQG